MTGLAVRAHAKINLYLKVLGRRPDGYHAIESVLQTITLHDTLTLAPEQGGVHLEVDPPVVPPGPDNLILKAAAALGPAAGASRGARIRLEKRIPAGSGLGGGSSDAAAGLVGLGRLWGLGMAPGDLGPIAAALGSDVPFFLTGGTALVTGRGTEIHPLPDRGGYEILLVLPGTPVPTREVYAQVQEPLTPPPKTVSMTRFGPALRGEIEAWVRVGNDLEPYAHRFCPAIGEIKARLQSAGATASAMTGSGSAVFGVFLDGARCRRAADEMEGLGWAALRCAPLGRREHRRHLGCS
jgi:4-diphosphocytidyl-2-C-methyl-D-erythritol kinase